MDRFDDNPTTIEGVFALAKSLGCECLVTSWGQVVVWGKYGPASVDYAKGGAGLDEFSGLLLKTLRETQWHSEMNRLRIEAHDA